MSARSKSNHFLVQGSILAAASILVRIIGLLYRIPMIRIIGKEGMGYYQNAFEIYSLALILSSFSIPIAVSRLVAVRRIKKEHRNSYRLFLCALIFSVTVGLVATLILFFGAGFFANMVYKSPNTTLPLQVLAPTIFVFSIMGAFRGFYQGKNTMIPTAVSQVLEQVVNAIVSVVAAWYLIKFNSAAANLSAYGAAGGTLGTFTGACAGLIFLLFVFVVYKPVLNRQIRHDASPVRESYQDLFKLLTLTIAPIILSQTVYQISGLLDGSLFGHIMSGKQIAAFDLPVLMKEHGAKLGEYYSESYRNTLTGIYSGEYRLLTNVPVAIAAAVGAAIVTTISADMARGMMDSIRHKIHVAIKFNMIIAIPSAVGMGVLASPVMYLLGDEYRLSTNIMMLGSVSIVFYALSTVSTAILQGINRLRVPVINSAISLGIHVLLVFSLLYFTPLSTYALVIGNVTFPMVICILNWISIARYMNYQQEVVKTYLIPTISAGLMGVITYFVYKGFLLWTGKVLVSTVCSILIAVIVYFTLLILLKGVNEEELSFVPKSGGILRILKKFHLL